MGRIDTYLWWNGSLDCWILFFACFTNSSQLLLFCENQYVCSLTITHYLATLGVP